MKRKVICYHATWAQKVTGNPHWPLTSKGRRATSGLSSLLDLCNLGRRSMFTCIQHSSVIVFLFWYINSSLEWLYTSCYGVATWNHLSSCTMQQISLLSTIGTTFFLCKVFNSIVEHGCHRRTWKLCPTVHHCLNSSFKNRARSCFLLLL